MMRRLWLLFAQAVTIALAVAYVLMTFQPGWFARLDSAAGLHRPGVGEAEPPSPAGARLTTEGPVSYAAAVKLAMPAVVSINTSKEVRVPASPFADDPIFRKFFGDQDGSRREQASSLGSGVIVSDRGYVLTNNHVVESADQIEVVLTDGRKSEAKLIGADPETDLAVLKINLQNLPVMAFGRADQIQVGDVVLAIGNPFGLESSVSMGIVSATGRTRLGINTFENFIQTDAAINAGNSGGALIDTHGSLLGINTAILSRTGTSAGIGFAIPSDIAKQVLDGIVATGQVVRGYIGVETQDVTPELAEAFGLPRSDGAIIAGVVRGGPADKAGVKTGDILVAVDGAKVVDSNAMLNQIARLAPGTKASLQILRDRQEMRLAVEVGRRPKVSAER